MSSNINNTSTKPIKKMVLWTRINNSKSTSPHIKENSYIEKKRIPKTTINAKKEVQPGKNEKKVFSPTMKSKDISNFSNNRNYLNYTRITTNKLLNSQGGSFQSVSNEEVKNNSKFKDSSNKKEKRESHFPNNIKFNKNININYSPNANNNGNNINTSEFHVNNTYKYFQAANEIKSKRKEKKANCITDNNIIINQSKKYISNKRISIERDKKVINNSKKKSSPNKTHLSNSINVNFNNNLSAVNNAGNNNINITAIFSQCKKSVNGIPPVQKNSNKNTYNEVLNDSNSAKSKKIEIYNSNNSGIIKNYNFEKMKNLEIENKKLKKENISLVQKNKELTVLVNKLENEILEIKSVIKENLNQFIQPQNDLMNKTYNQIMEQIEKQKSNLSKILNSTKLNISSIETSKTKDNETTNFSNQKTIINNERSNYRTFKKNFFEFFNHVNTSNTTVNGNPASSDPLKNILNSFCCFMDNIMNKIEDKFIKVDKTKDNNNTIEMNSINNNFAEICLINLFYEYVIMQLFIVSFFERQHCYYCHSIIDYILISPFVALKTNTYIQDFTKKINQVIEVYKKINEEYINRFTEQNIFYLDNYIKLFDMVISNRIHIGNNLNLDNDNFEKNTNLLFNNNKQAQNVYLTMINNLFEKIKNFSGNESLEKFFEQNKNKGKNKINMIKISGDNVERISNISNCSSKIIDNYSEKPSFYGFLRNDECPPDISFGDDDV